MIEFRWVALLALWTLLAGPVFGPPTGGGAKTPKKTTHAKKVPTKG